MVPLYNRRGQLLREKGRKTRAAIVSQTVEMLSSAPLSEVTMASVTKKLGLDAAAFYTYFEDIGDVILAAHESVAVELDQLLSIVELDWPPREIHDRALQFVDAYYAIWLRHSVVLKARNFIADSGDTRFTKRRMLTALPLADALVKKLEPDDKGNTKLAPAFPMASLLITVVERAATITAHAMYDPSLNWADVRLGLAEMIEGAIVKRTSES